MNKSLFTIVLCLLCLPILSACRKKMVLVIHTNVHRFDLPLSFVSINTFEGRDTLFYSADFHSRKKILFFNQNGQVVHAIDVKPIIDTFPYQMYIPLMIDDGRLAIRCDQNQILILDTSGRVKKHLDFRNEYFNGLKMMGNFRVSHEYLYTGFVGIVNPGQTLSNDPIASGNYFHQLAQFGRISLKTGKCEVFGHNLIKRYLPRQCIDADATYFDVLDGNHVIYNSPFTDTVYEVSVSDVIRPLHRVTSKVQSLACPPFTLKQYLSSPDFGKNIFRSHASIQNILFDARHEIYYAIIRKPCVASDATPPIEIRVYDSNWNLLGTKLISSNTYQSMYFLSSKGLMIEKYQGMSTNRRFDLITVEEE